MKCIYNSDIQKFYIHENKERPYIFVSVNSDIELCDKEECISSQKYIDSDNPKYQNYYIIAKGIGCFQIYYLEKTYFRFDEDNTIFNKSFNILTENFKFNIYNSFKQS